LLYVSDLVAGILLALRQDGASGQAYNLNGPEAPTWNEYFQRFAAALALPHLKVIEPNTANLRAGIMEPLRIAAKFVRERYERPVRQVAGKSGLLKNALKWAEGTMKMTPRPTDLDLYSRKALYVAKKAQDMLGFKPVYGVDLGIDMSVRWLEQVGLVQRHGATGGAGPGEGVKA
jgi:nucleoside-diphosphate-sugar epimerase